MSSNPDPSMDELHQLLAERGRYEHWMAQLEERRNAAPAHVLERVRADYAGRLEQVISHLRGRAVELDATVSALRSRLAALASEEETRRDERAETELRAAVGEFEPGRAQQTIAQCDEAITSLTAQRGALGGELAKLQDILHQVMNREPARPVPVAAAPSTPAPLAQDAPSALESIAALAPDAEPAQIRPEDPTPSAVEELEFLRSVVNPDASEGEGSELLPNPVLSAPRRSATPMSAAIVGGIKDPLRALQGDGSLSENNMPAFLKDMPTEQAKTLKCQECGTMNYPTEWYCERCGGELAAM